MSDDASAKKRKTLFTPDDVVRQLAPGGSVTERAVMVRGWLSAERDGSAINGVYRVFTSSRFEAWLDINEADLLFRQPSADQPNGDGSSMLWVRRDAPVTRCYKAEAWSIVDNEPELGSDPTAAGTPRYGRGGG